MRDEERLEYTYRQIIVKKQPNTSRYAAYSPNGPVPIEIGNLKLRKLTPAEREQCKKEIRCLSCHQKGHTSKNSPKVQRS